MGNTLPNQNPKEKNKNNDPTLTLIKSYHINFNAR